MAPEAGDDNRRVGDYRSARIGASAALVAVLVLLLLWDAVSPEYELRAESLFGLIGAVGGLLGIELFRGIRK